MRVGGLDKIQMEMLIAPMQHCTGTTDLLRSIVGKGPSQDAPTRGATVLPDAAR